MASKQLHPPLRQQGCSNVPDQTVAFGAKATTPTAPTKTATPLPVGTRRLV
ncbi:hypothetical protein GWK75_01540 [Candidatus Saccharibacteria bacterium oral taxon 955]|nr:hypothetical protein GWK75_01540 [Candidatus Saccharibacteria bacterium oral taxon 955]